MRCALGTEERSGLPVGPKRARDRASQRISVTKCLSFRRSSVRAAILELAVIMPHARHRSHAEACRRDQSGCCTPARTAPDHSRQGGMAHHPQAQASRTTSPWFPLPPRLARKLNAAEKTSGNNLRQDPISPIACSKPTPQSSTPARNAWRRPSQRARPPSRPLPAATGPTIG